MIHLQTVRAHVLSLCVVLMVTTAALAKGPAIPAKVKKNIDARIEAGCSPGYVVGLVSADGITWCCRGTYSYDISEPVSARTIFEIGSITKAFTGILLADCVSRRLVRLDDPISRFLPEGVTAPAVGDRSITLLDLAQHRSGLPRLPSNFEDGANPNDPYAHYDAPRLYEFLETHTLERKPGEAYEYSNLGAGLLGHLLSLAAKRPYAELVGERICRPLGMIDTTFALSDDQKKRLAPGHSGPKRASNWSGFDVLAPAGGLCSTGDDMIQFIAANLGLRESKLADALAAAIRPRAAADSRHVQVALGWHISSDKGTEIIWHNGGTGGYRSFCGFAPDKKLGVVVLTNSNEGADDIGFHLLESKYKLQKAPRRAKVAEKLLAACVGKYELAPGVIIDITLDAGTLYARLTGQEAIPVYPRSENEFVYRVVDARLTFRRDEAGRVEQVTLHQNGRDMPARRLPDDYAPPPPPQEVEVSEAVLKKYVGRYELQPGAVFDVRLEGGRLTVQLTGQARLPVFPESQTTFFYKVVDARITFVMGEGDRADQLVLHQFGIDQTARRLPD